MSESMQFPKTPEEFIKDYSFKDKEEVYTNGSELISVFRVQQMIEYYFPVIHGKWINCDNGGYYCSNCDSRIAFRLNHNYCPRCGAMMVEVNINGSD